MSFRFILLSVLVFVLGLAPFSKAADKPKRVVTSFTIIADIVSNVAGSCAIVESITKPGAEIHEYDPSPRDVVKAQKADLIIANGMNLELWFDKFYGELTNVPRLILAEKIKPMGIRKGPYQGKPNPHTWMSPANVMIYVESICKTLSEIDPVNAAAYRKNADIYLEQLKEIDSLLRSSLAAIPKEKRWLVSSEGAFSYLASDYGLQEAYIWPINADEEGSPKQIKELVDLIRLHKIPCLFSESTISDKPARQIAKESGAAYAGMLYVDSLTDAKGPAPTLLKMLQYNVQAIVAGLSIKGTTP